MSSAPLLLELGGLPATVFVVSGLMGEPNPWMETRGRPAVRSPPRRSWSAATPGWEIGAHTEPHPDLSTLDREACAREMRASRTSARDADRGPGCRRSPTPSAASGRPPAPRSPTPTSSQRSPARRAARGGPHALRRTIIIRRDSDLVFVARLAGIYDPLFYGRAGTWLRDRTRLLRTALYGACARGSDAAAAGLLLLALSSYGELGGAELSIAEFAAHRPAHVALEALLLEDGPLRAMLGERGVRTGAAAGYAGPPDARRLARFARELHGVLGALRPDVVWATGQKAGPDGGRAVPAAGRAAAPGTRSTSPTTHCWPSPLRCRLLRRDRRQATPSPAPWDHFTTTG